MTTCQREVKGQSVAVQEVVVSEAGPWVVIGTSPVLCKWDQTAVLSHRSTLTLCVCVQPGAAVLTQTKTCTLSCDAAATPVLHLL